MRGAIPPLPQYDFMAWCSVEKGHGDNFTFHTYNKQTNVSITFLRHLKQL